MCLCVYILAEKASVYGLIYKGKKGWGFVGRCVCVGGCGCVCVGRGGWGWVGGGCVCG